MRVLAVEDNNLDLELLRASLSKHSEIEPVFVRTMQEANQHLEGVDVVILDLFLEDSTPEQTLQWIRTQSEKNPPLPVIVLSWNDSPETIREAAILGAIGYITKKSVLDQLWTAMIFAQEEWKRSQAERDRRSKMIRDLVGRIKLSRSEEV